MTKLHNSRIIIIIDKHFEIFLSKVLANLTQKHKLIEIAKIPGVKLLKNSKEDENLHHHHHISPYDLHLWLDIEIIKTASKEIVRFLSEVTPSNQNKYEANLAEFVIKLDSLDDRIKKKTSTIDKEDYIVTHNAYRYFIKRYNLKEPKTITIDHDHNIGARSFIQLQELIRNNKVKCIFEEPQFKSQVVKKLEENSNVRVGSLDAEWGPKDISIEDAYIAMMDNLADSFVTCLK
jgi:zinc transport system substrate-binding protein